MKQSTREAYEEVDEILSFMEDKYINEVPKKLRDLFKENKAQDYKKNIDPSKPLEEQNLSRETLAILAILNYNYWCKDKEQKKKLMEIYSENERKYQEQLREKYNPDELFKNKEINKEPLDNEEEQTDLIVTEEKKWYAKLLDFIINLFKKKTD